MGEKLHTSWVHLVSKNATASFRQKITLVPQNFRNRCIDSPTTTNSTGIQTLKKWNKILRAGHPGVFIRRHVLGDKTRVSHAATVRVQTRKYLCALRWGGRLRAGGRESARDMMGEGVKLSVVVWREDI